MVESQNISVLYRQLWQVLAGILAVSSFWYLVKNTSFLPSGEYLGISNNQWFWSAILIPIFHQLIIAPLWRMELIDNLLTKFFGSTDRAFTFFKILFSIFFIPRMLITIPLAISTQQTIERGVIKVIFLVIAILTTPIVVFGFYSVRKYFGINRAYGADHFYQHYRDLPMVKEGLFKYIDNVMYTVVLFVVVLPGLYLGSFVAVIAGLFNQLFVWVHYYTTEKPDMEFIYH